MSKSCSIALKEWAVVQHALLEGKQIFLLRKGGLIEETGQFELRSNQFLTQPTYIHETERGGDIQPQYLDWLREEEARKTPNGQIRFEAYCDVAETIEVKHPDALIQLSSEHIWSESFINMRLDWEPYKPLFVVIVRAYKLPEPITIDAHPDYFGCKSWIDLHEAVSVEGVVPAIQDENHFIERVESIKRLLRSTGVLVHEE